VLEVRRSVVAGTVVELRVGAVEFYRQAAVAAVARRVGGVEAEDVVRLGVVLDLLEGGGEVVGV
jgi:hypothetical protein